MAKTILAPEVVALIHHVELTRAGWWDRALERMVITVLYSNPLLTLDVETIREALTRDFRLRDVGDRLMARLADLCKQEKLSSDNGGYKLTESALRECRREVSATEALMQEVERSSKQRIAEQCPSLDADSVWADLKDHFLIPLVTEMGAKTYRMISGKSPALETPRLDSFLRRFPDASRDGLTRVVQSLLDPSDANTRDYVLRLLDIAFLIQSANPSGQDMDRLISTSNVRPNFNLFLDTNFIFSMLDLHDNPANEATRLLLDMLTQARRVAKVQLYVLPVTIDEAKTALATAEHGVSGISPTRDLAKVALETGVSGLTHKYMQQVQRNPGLSPDEYFGRYKHDLLSLCRARSVELYNAPLAAYRTDQRVTADLESERRSPVLSRKTKPTDLLEHDVILWYFVADLRPSHVDGPVDAQHWVVTVDRGVIDFDSEKRTLRVTTLPVAVDPSTLIQMLRLWVPRSPEFEKAMLASMRLPLLTKQFDSEAERTTLRILRALSEFEDQPEMPQSVLTQIVMNRAMRYELQTSTGPKDDKEIVRNTANSLVGQVHVENRKLKEDLAQLTREKERHQREIEALRRQKKVRGDRLREAGRSSNAWKKTKEAQQRQLEQLTRERDDARRLASEAARRALLGTAFISAILCAVVGVIIHALLSRTEQITGLGAILLPAVVMLPVWLHALTRLSGKELHESMQVETLRKFRNWSVSGLLGTVLLELISNSMIKSAG